jgi:hypothetical protein
LATVTFGFDGLDELAEGDGVLVVAAAGATVCVGTGVGS